MIKKVSIKLTSICKGGDKYLHRWYPLREILLYNLLHYTLNNAYLFPQIIIIPYSINLNNFFLCLKSNIKRIFFFQSFIKVESIIKSLYKADISIRRTEIFCTDGVRFREILSILSLVIFNMFKVWLFLRNTASKGFFSLTMTLLELSHIIFQETVG